MEHLIVLDAAVKPMLMRIDAWQQDGFTVEGPTWRESDGWPQRISPERATIADPDSVGVRLWRGAKEGSVVLYVGGWADVEYWSGDENDDVVLEAPGWIDPLTVETFAGLLDRWRSYFD
jgi:hypothetical protein